MLLPLAARRARTTLALVAVASFGCGALVATLAAPRVAGAQAFSSTIQVPRGGLTFRAPDGRAVARVSYDEHGGIFEVLDEHGRAVSTLGAGAAESPLATKPSAKTVWSVDDTPDPWVRPPPAVALPSSGL